MRGTTSPDWRYEPTRSPGVVWVGYNLRSARFLLRTAALTGREDLFRAGGEIVEFCLRHGVIPDPGLWSNRHRVRMGRHPDSAVGLSRGFGIHHLPYRSVAGLSSDFST